LAVNAGNFARAAAFAALASLATISHLDLDRAGVVDAVLSGALTSGVGYAIWYAALRDLDVTRAAVSQLSVPVIAALGGIALLGEAPTLRLALASVAILGGIALVVVPRRAQLAPPRPDGDPVVPQDVVRGGDVEVEVRDRAAEQERHALVGRVLAADLDDQLLVLAAVDLRGLQRLEELHRL